MAAESSAVLCSAFTAPSNIACIKYWGKRDSKTNTPINSSVSVTLNQDDLKAITTVYASKDFDSDRLWLNGKEEDIAGSKRVQAVLREIRARARDRPARPADVDGDGAPAQPAVAAAEWPEYHVHVVSANTFPTAAGLASSAAGYACLVAALSDMYNVVDTYPGELTAIARQGSGSASRSLYGGFVRWEMGTKDDGSDSIAVQVADEKHWPELEILICVVSDKKKETGSTEGMDTSVRTSELLKHRASAVVPARLEAIEAAYKAKDFDTFGRITMADSNQFHATCLDTFPPIFYMNDTSRYIIGLVHRLNKWAGRTVAAYTFDAGPNAVLYVLKDDTAFVLKLLLDHFPGHEAEAEAGAGAGAGAGDLGPGFVSNPETQRAAEAAADIPPELACDGASRQPTAVRKIYHTTVGDGPRRSPSEAIPHP